jgi:hypothetical protein
LRGLFLGRGLFLEDCFWRGTVFGGGLSWPWVCSLVLGLFFEEGYFLGPVFSGLSLSMGRGHFLTLGTLLDLL